ncbi:hypothetical protein [Bradyrhizobium elkanii]
MNSTPTPNPVGSNDSLRARADERLAEAQKQIARADEELTRLSEQLARMERDAASRPSVQPNPPSVEPSPASSGPSPSSSGPASQSRPGRPIFRALTALSVAACIVVAALALQSSYGGEAKLLVARWAPQLVSTPALPPDDPQPPAQPAPPAVQVAAADTAPPQATPLPQPAPPQDAAPTANTALPDQTQLLQTIARDLANVERNIEQLKANQQQMARENSKAIEELKASQEEMKRALAKVFRAEGLTASDAAGSSRAQARADVYPAIRKGATSNPKGVVLRRMVTADAAILQFLIALSRRQAE